MADLATVADLEARLGRSLDATETIRAEALLAGASARVRAYTGQSFEQSTSTDRVQVRNGRAVLPQRPVSAVSAVADTDANDVDFDWYSGDTVALMLSDVFDREPYRHGLLWVDVTYTHGYASIPADVVEVVCSMVLRAFGVQPDATGYSSESIDDYTYRVGTVAAAGVVGMLPQEKEALAPYRRMGGTIRVAS